MGSRLLATGLPRQQGDSRRSLDPGVRLQGWVRSQRGLQHGREVRAREGRVPDARARPHQRRPLAEERRVLDLQGMHHGHRDEAGGIEQGCSSLEHVVIPDSADIAQSPVV